jgi:mRNA-degrading endonuclease RelE of RelBE toxin-antitoxin system
MEFIEATSFSKHIYEYLSDEEYKGLQTLLIINPEMGKVVSGSGGVRKIRWSVSGRGKSSRVRVIYYYKKTDSEIWLLTIYKKNEIEKIPSHILKQIAKEIEND